MRVNAGVGNWDASAVTPTKSCTQEAQSFAAVLKWQGGVESTVGESDKFDFTHITANELHKTVGGLIRSGQMDLGESSSLLGFMGASPLDKVSYDGSAPAQGDEPFNAFQRIQDAIEGVLSRNEVQSAEGLQTAYDALARFQRHE